MAARAKTTNRSKRVDSVRASRDGHQFHEAWVARRALGLLLPRFDLYGIAVEGLSEEDEEAGRWPRDGSRLRSTRNLLAAKSNGHPTPYDDQALLRGAFTVTRRVSVLVVAEWARAPTYVPPLHDIRGLKPRLRQR